MLGYRSAKRHEVVGDNFSDLCFGQHGPSLPVPAVGRQRFSRSELSAESLARRLRAHGASLCAGYAPRAPVSSPSAGALPEAPIFDR